VSEVSFTSAASHRRWRAAGALPGRVRSRISGDLADEDVAGLHFRADANDAVRAEVAQGFLGDVRDVAGDFLGPELGVAAPISNSSMWMEV